VLPIEYSVEGKVAIVTGAGRGIGKSIAVTLAEAGANVTVAARTVKQIEETADEVRQLGRKALVIPADVSRSDQVRNVVEKTVSEFGKIDVMVNNAGIDLLKPIAFVPEMREKKLPEWEMADSWDIQLTEEEWRKVIDTNLTSAFLFAQAIAPYMMKQKKGKVISISSNSADLGPPYFSAYCASKAGLSAFTRCLSSEWAPFNICVNAIGPGTILTEMSEEVLQKPGLRDFMLKYIPTGRFGQTREVALLALYLASDASNFISGETIYIDGGQRARGNGI
jgi:NAD(P)-dependent dehydrogenase (short-subunit alcohol dehydrogenase family)